MPYLLDCFFIAWFDSILRKTSLFFLLYILGSWLKSHLLVEVASWLAPATQNTVLLKSCDLIFVLNHTWLPFYQRASTLFPWLTYSSIVDFVPRVSFFAPDSEAIGVITSTIGRVACLRFGAGLLVPLQGAAAGCPCKVLLSELCAFWSWVDGAAAGVPLQGAAARCCCKSAVCALEPGCWCAAGCCCRVPLLVLLWQASPGAVLSFSLLVFRSKRALVGRLVCL